MAIASEGKEHHSCEKHSKSPIDHAYYFYHLPVFFICAFDLWVYEEECGAV
jgi:hypothetical protein